MKTSVFYSVARSHDPWAADTNADVRRAVQSLLKVIVSPNPKKGHHGNTEHRRAEARAPRAAVPPQRHRLAPLDRAALGGAGPPRLKRRQNRRDRLQRDVPQGALPRGGTGARGQQGTAQTLLGRRGVVPLGPYSRARAGDENNGGDHFHV